MAKIKKHSQKNTNQILILYLYLSRHNQPISTNVGRQKTRIILIIQGTDSKKISDPMLEDLKVLLLPQNLYVDTVSGQRR